MVQGNEKYVIMQLVIIADNIRSMHNVGAIFRSSAGFGVEKLYLVGITPVPPRKEIEKVALGADLLVPWEYVETIAPIVERLKADGYAVLALETGDGAVPIETMKNEKAVLILGNEAEGLSAETLALANAKVEIPMGAKRSLNVSVATGIAIYALKRNMV